MRCDADVVTEQRRAQKGDARCLLYLSDLPSLNAVRLLGPGRVADGPDSTNVELARVFGVLDDRNVALEDISCTARGREPLEELFSFAHDSKKREDVPMATSSGCARTNMVCFQCVGVSHAPVVKNTSPSSLLTLCSRRLESASRGAEVK
jgi:hypothetical protein